MLFVHLRTIKPSEDQLIGAGTEEGEENWDGSEEDGKFDDGSEGEENWEKESGREDALISIISSKVG